MDCTRARNLLSEYADGALDKETAAVLEAHLSSCGECREELSSLQSMIKDLGSLPPVAPPADFLQQVRKRLEHPSRLRQVPGKLFFPLKFKIPLQLAGAVLTALLVFAVVMVQRQPYKVAEAPQAIRPEEGSEKRQAVKEDKAVAPAGRPATKAVGLKEDPRVFELTLVLARMASSPQAAAPAPALEAKSSEQEGRGPRAAVQADASDRTAKLEGTEGPVEKSIEAFQGRILSVEHENGRPVLILAEIPSHRFPSLLNDLRELGEVRVPPSVPFDETQGSLKISVRIVSGD